MSNTESDRKWLYLSSRSVVEPIAGEESIVEEEESTDDFRRRNTHPATRAQSTQPAPTDTPTQMTGNECDSETSLTVESVGTASVIAVMAGASMNSAAGKPAFSSMVFIFVSVN
jgi:hypothetical protein